jgi:hypothetical protein
LTRSALGGGRKRIGRDTAAGCATRPSARKIPRLRVDMAHRTSPRGSGPDVDDLEPRLGTVLAYESSRPPRAIRQPRSRPPSVLRRAQVAPRLALTPRRPASGLRPLLADDAPPQPRSALPAAVKVEPPQRSAASSGGTTLRAAVTSHRGWAVGARRRRVPYAPPCPRAQRASTPPCVAPQGPPQSSLLVPTA